MAAIHGKNTKPELVVGHEGCKYYRTPKTNTDFWINKVRRNKERDHKVCQKLALMGWHSITIWECELKLSKRERTLESLTFTLNKIFLQDYRIKKYEISEEKLTMVAEDIADKYGNKIKK